MMKQSAVMVLVAGLSGAVVAAGMTWLTDNAAVMGDVVTRYCETVEAEQRQSLREAVNESAAPYSVVINCE